ncbi:MAG: hypothetical protein QM803_09885 [Rhodocyclaceae bacterium]
MGGGLLNDRKMRGKQFMEPKLRNELVLVLFVGIVAAVCAVIVAISFGLPAFAEAGTICAIDVSVLVSLSLVFVVSILRLFFVNQAVLAAMPSWQVFWSDGMLEGIARKYRKSEAWRPLRARYIAYFFIVLASGVGNLFYASSRMSNYL